jgi:hypothetical protein
MHRAVTLALLACLATLLMAGRAAATELDFGVYLLAVPVGNSIWTLDLTPTSYRMAMNFQTTGIADLFAKDQLSEHASGRIVEGQPVPIEYVSDSHRRGDDRLVNLQWHDGSPVLTTITPPNSVEREDVPMELRLHTIDPLSATVLMLRQVAQTGRCEATARTYDGRRASLFRSYTSGEENVPQSVHSIFSGPALRCDFIEHTLAGFRLGSAREEDVRDRPGTMWLTQLYPGGPRLPVRATVATPWFGAATFYLTGSRP